MSTIWVVLITIVSTVVGIFILFGIFGSSSSNNKPAETQSGDYQQEGDDNSGDQSSEISYVKDKTEALLEEANAKCAELEKELQAVLSGKSKGLDKAKLAEIENLKKKIKNLEDDLEEAEDDKADAKKKLKRKEDELQDVRGKYDKEVQESKSLRSALEATRAELEEKAAALTLKVGSLDFVQEILSAPLASTEDVKKLEVNINELGSFIFNQAFSVYGKTEGWVVWRDNPNFKEALNNNRNWWHGKYVNWASVTRKSWLHNKRTVAFVGEFSAGKTSIVNRILSQDDPQAPLLPVSAKATTAIPTYIAGGPATSYKFVTPNGEQKTISAKTFTGKVSKEILGQIHGVQSLIKYFVMTYKNPHLNGLSILDTPGFNSNDKEDADRTMEVINECDALFWVFDVNSGTINRSSIETIKRGLNKDLYVVINKVDTKAPSEVDKVETLIKNTLSQAGIEVKQYIRFSSKAPIDNIMKPISGVAPTQGKDTFLADFRGDIETYRNIMNNHITEKQKLYDDAKAKVNDVQDAFAGRLNDVQNAIVVAMNIPHYESHIFHSNKYEMSVAEAANMQEIMTDAVQSVRNLCDTDEIVNASNNAQQCWSNLCEVKSLAAEIAEILTRFDEIAKNFK